MQIQKKWLDIAYLLEGEEAQPSTISKPVFIGYVLASPGPSPTSWWRKKELSGYYRNPGPSGAPRDGACKCVNVAIWVVGEDDTGEARNYGDR